MKLSKFRDDANYYTGKLSDIVRQYSFAGIAVIWVFKRVENNNVYLEFDLLWPAILILTSLFCDLIQYVYQATFWSFFYRKKEKEKLKIDPNNIDPDILANPRANYFSWICFTSKVLFLIVAYVLIIIYLYFELLT